MGDFELFEKIEAFLKGELSPEEMKNFELEIKNNSSFAEAVEMHRLEWDAMEVLIENDLREKMVHWDKPFIHASHSSKSLPSEKREITPTLRTTYKPSDNRRLYWKWTIAASIVLLVTASIWIFILPKTTTTEMAHTQVPSESGLPNDKAVQPPPSTQDNTPQYSNDTVNNSKTAQKESPQKDKNKEIILPEKQKPNTQNPIIDNITYGAIAEQAYEKDDIPSYEAMQTTRGSTNSGTVLDQAGKAYDKKDFTQAITLLKNTPATDENFMSLEILAHAYFQSKNYKAALPVFQNLLQLSGRKSLEKSEWYVLLCYLANYEKYQKDFNALAQKIMSNEQHAYYAATKTLWERVRKK